MVTTESSNETYKYDYNVTEFFSSPSYYVWRTLVIVQIFDFQFLVDLHVSGSGESKKHKTNMVSRCSLVVSVSVLVC